MGLKEDWDKWEPLPYRDGTHAYFAKNKHIVLWGRYKKLVLDEAEPDGIRLRKNRVHMGGVAGNIDRHFYIFYTSQLSRLCERQAKKLTRETGLKPKAVWVDNLEKSWGLCDEFGNITLALGLALLPHEATYAILAHELAHLEHFNHSKAFYKTLYKICPEYDLWRKFCFERNTYIPLGKRALDTILK